MYNVCQTTEFMPKVEERTMPSKFSSCDNALPSRSTSTSLVLKRAKFRNHQLHFLTLTTTNIKTQEETKMPLCKLKKKNKTKQKTKELSLAKVLAKKLRLEAQNTCLLFTDSNVNLRIDRDL